MFYVLGRIIPDPEIEPPIPENPPLTLTATQNNSYVKLNKNGNLTVNGLQFRTDDTDDWEPYTIGTRINLSNGEYVQFQNTEEELSNYYDNVNFEMRW